MKQNIYYDSEYIEGTQDKRFLGIKYGKTKPTIDLISIALVSEKGAYYAISKDFNLKEAWNRYDLKYNTGMGDRNNAPPTKVYWIRENVLRPIYEDLYDMEFIHGWDPFVFCYSELKKLIGKYGKTNKEIADDIKNFVCPYDNRIHEGYDAYMKSNPVELFGYYSDYDHVALSWLFGNMIDLPAGFPMFTTDLKQKLDSLLMLQENVYPNESRLESFLKSAKSHALYPKQENEHSALDDAEWVKKLHKFINHIENHGLSYGIPDNEPQAS